MPTNKVFTDIYSNIGSNIQDTSSAMQTIIKRYCNEAYFDILRRINWQGIDPSYNISAVAGTQDYILPNNFSKELYVFDDTNNRPLSWISLQELIEKYPSTWNSQGTVERYTIFQDVVRANPSSSSALSISSSSVADTTQTVRVKGIDSNNVELDESVTLNGTTAVVTANSYTAIRSITKSATTTGRITTTSNGGAVTVAVMSSADFDYKVIKLRLHEVPNNAITIRIPYFIRPYPLVNDYDAPVIDCADGIELGATMRAWRYKRQFAKAADMERQYELWINQAIWDQENQPNRINLLNPKPYSRDYV